MADDFQEEEPKEYRWETGYEKTWEAIKEDDDGQLDTVIAEIILKAKRKRQTEKVKRNRLGIMRHMFLIIDCSESMSVPDLKPSRMTCTRKLLEIFIEEYFDQNPISQLGLILLRGKRAEKITELSGTPKAHLKGLDIFNKITPAGEPSIQNGLEMGWKHLKLLPSHASREILLIMSSLTTCDPSDINITIEALKQDRIRCSVISLSAEVRLCRYLTQQTNGTLGAVLDDSHYRELLLAHIDPPPAAQTQVNSLIKMGFPSAGEDESIKPPLSMCVCHLDSTDEPSKLTTEGYFCPKCSSKYCELPVECKTCGLTLVSAPHLARSYHHLFPVKHYIESPNTGNVKMCFSCRKVFTKKDLNVYLCEACEQYYCVDCDIFIHDNMHTCPGCTTIPTVAKQTYARQPQMPSTAKMATSSQ